MKEMAKEVQNSRSGEAKKTAEDLDEFMNKVRSCFSFVFFDVLRLVVFSLFTGLIPTKH